MLNGKRRIFKAITKTDTRSSIIHLYNKNGGFVLNGKRRIFETATKIDKR